MAKRKHRGQSAAFMRSINPNLKNRKVNKGRSSSTPMARRKSRRTSRRSRGYSSGNLIKEVAVGGAGYLAYKYLLSSKIPLQGNTLNMAEAIGSYLLATKVRNPMLKSVGKVGFIIEALGLADGVLAGAMSGGTSMSGPF